MGPQQSRFIEVVTSADWHVSDFDFSDDIVRVAYKLMAEFPDEAEGMTLEMARASHASHEIHRLKNSIGVLYFIALKQDRLDIPSYRFISEIADCGSLPWTLRLRAVSIIAIGCRRLDHQERTEMYSIVTSAINAIEEVISKGSLDDNQANRVFSEIRWSAFEKLIHRL